MLLTSAWHSEVLHIRNFRGHLVVARSRSNCFHTSANFRPLARAKTKLGRRLLKLIAVVHVSTRSRHFKSTAEIAPQLYPHWKTGVLILGWRKIGVVSSCSGGIQRRQAFEFLAHDNSFLFECSFCYIIVTGCWNRLRHLVIVHPALAGTKTVVRRFQLDELTLWIIRTRFSYNTFGRACCRSFCTLRSADTVVGCRP